MSSKLIPVLVARRNELAISQRALEAMIGVSDAMVAKWESGQRSPTTKSLERWASALGYEILLRPVGQAKKRKTRH